MRAEGFVPPHRKGRGGSVSRRDHNQAYPIEDAPNSHGRTSPKERTSLFPAALREKGSGEEGKDSHSRQWRLSIAVFLNRNKQP